MRLKRVAVSGIIFEQILTQGKITNVECIKGLPKGAQFRFACPGTVMGLAMIFEHPDWDIVKPGDTIPQFDDIEFKRLDDK